jgi:nucleotide-binding universal stress UspA family protein
MAHSNTQEPDMRIVIGVDWSDQAFAAVTQTFHLYRPAEVTLVHGVDLGYFRYPILAEAANLQGYDEFRHSMVEAGHQLLERTASMVPSHIQSVKQINEIGSPARVILDAAQSAGADLVVVGDRGHSRVTEAILGSVSHRVLSHASRPTLIVKGSARPLQQVLVAVEGQDDAELIKHWLLTHPFNNPVALSILTVVQSLRLADPYNFAGIEAWSDAAMRYAEDLVKETGAGLMGPHYTVSTHVATGHPASMVEEKADAMDLVVVASHGRTGIDRFLLGSVSHAIVHHVTCPVLVLR